MFKTERPLSLSVSYSGWNLQLMMLKVFYSELHTGPFQIGITNRPYSTGFMC